MDYLLDTSACVEAIKNRTPLVRKRLGESMRAGARVYVSSIASFELWYGAAKSARPERNARRIADFLAGPIEVLPFEFGDAQEAGDIGAALERLGTPIGPYDVLIAAQARRRRALLVTANGREFGRVPGLKFEDWATSE